MAARRRGAVLAAEPQAALDALTDPAGIVRAAALSAAHRLGVLDADRFQAGLTDPDPAVRGRALEIAGRTGTDPAPADLVTALLDDPDPSVVETACWAIGELAAGRNAPPGLTRVATDHDDPLCREAAVAALGAIGHPDGLAAIMTGLDDKPAVRRRSTLALAPFLHGPDGQIEAVASALTRMLDDRDRQVRQAAEDLLGR